MKKLTLKELRERLGLTQAEVALALGCTKSTYANWESGLRSPSIADALKIADLFGRDPREIDWPNKRAVLKPAVGGEASADPE